MPSGSATGQGRSGLAVYINPDMMMFKPLRWLGDCLDRVRGFDPEARARVGYELWEIQLGRDPSDWKPMSSVGPGVNEIRIHAMGEYRVLYVAKFPEAVYVLHAFSKTTRRTSQKDLELAAARYRALVNEKRRQG